MSRSIALSSLTAALLVFSCAASAATITAPARASFTVTNACTVTGIDSILTSYTTSDTWNTYAGRQGVQDLTAGGAITRGTEDAVGIARINCPTGVLWTLHVTAPSGTGNVDVLDPNNNVAFQVAPAGIDVDGVPLPAGPVILHDSALGVARVGTGAPQTLSGAYLAVRYASTNQNAPMIAGTYTLPAQVRLDF
jgi:hypothetical protein